MSLAHILGNMWAQEWSSIMDLVAPFPDIPAIDVTPELQKQHYDAVDIHKTAEEFYTSIGFDPLPDTFWNRSMLTKPTDREAVCHARYVTSFMFQRALTLNKNVVHGILVTMTCV
jgi:peptidyl-dipeptidase A